ncbi:MAG: urease accessory protein UreD [Gammaproteobacteria bacterium]|nr:urease accessory protein UreD [Gammaproteobacteria bacterium]
MREFASPPSNIPKGEKANGWQASLSLGFELRRERTVLTRRSHRGPLVVQRPFYPGDGVCHLYLLHPPGGVVGGDRLSVDLDLAPGCAALITTPGATKLYRCNGLRASLEHRMRVADGASLEWLPQECILFPGAAGDVSTKIQLEGTARVAAWEIQCLGLPALGQRFDNGDIGFNLEIWKDDSPLLLERLSLTTQVLDSLSGMRGMPVIGTMVVGPATDRACEMARGVLVTALPDCCGATLVDGLLVVRYLGESTSRVRHLFFRVWLILRQLLLGWQPCAPRIWAT